MATFNVVAEYGNTDFGPNEPFVVGGDPTPSWSPIDPLTKTNLGDYLNDGDGDSSVVSTFEVDIDGTKVPDNNDGNNLDLKLGDNNDIANIYIDLAEFDNFTGLLKVSQSRSEDCVIFSNVLSITGELTPGPLDPPDAHTTEDWTQYGGQTRSYRIEDGDATPIPNHTNDDQTITITYLDKNGSTVTMSFEVDDDLCFNVEFHCFGTGTRIAVPGGTRAVEELAIGDSVLTASGVAVAVKWVGRRALAPWQAAFADMRPVRIAKDALGHGVPSRDLVITADHALFLDGLMITAGALVNGGSLRLLPTGEIPWPISFYHIETENHEVILANDVPAETYIDYTSRKDFENYDEYLELYGAERTIAELPYPRISAARLLPSPLRQRLQGAGARPLEPV